MERWQKLLREAQTAAKDARDLAAKAEATGGTMTATEEREYRAKFAEATDKKSASDQAKKDAESQADLKALADDDGDAPLDGGNWHGNGRNGGTKATPWAREVMGRLTKAAGAVGVKALLQGEISTPPVFAGSEADGDVVSTPSAYGGVLSLVASDDQRDDGTSGDPTGGNVYSYLRQVTRTENVAAVADLATKPTSAYVWQEIEERYRIVAHLSEEFPLRYLTDFGSMVQVLDAQMRQGVLRELERQVVAGDGVGENFTGVLNTSGVTDVPFNTDRVTTVRKARTALDTLGEDPTGWALHPDDAEAFDLLRDTTGGFLLDSTVADTIFGPGTRRVTSLAVPAGTALFGDWQQIQIKVRHGAHSVAATQAGTLFDRNAVKVRAEGRFGIKLRRPAALAVVHLEAPPP